MSEIFVGLSVQLPDGKWYSSTVTSNDNYLNFINDMYEFVDDVIDDIRRKGVFKHG